jgi:hypothetical protein
MTIAVWTQTPDMAWARTPIRPAEVIAFAPGGSEQRADLQDRTRWEYYWPMSISRSEMLAVEAFLEARSWVVEAFFVREPRNGRYARTGVSIGTGDGVETVFSIPSSGDEAGDYPIDDANAIVYVDGSPVTVSSVDTEDQTFTLAAAATNLKPVTADYHYYRLVRLLDRFEFASLGPDFWSAAPSFRETGG